MKLFSTLLALTLLFTACNSGGEKAVKTGEEKKTERIVSLGGTITEILYELGAEKEIVGVDITSTYPASAEKLTNLGHVSGITFENVLSTKPTKVFAFEDEMHPELQEKLEAAKIEVILIKREFTIKGAKNTIAQLAKTLAREDKVADLNSKIDNDLKDVKKPVKSPKVLFVYARGTGMMMVAGDNTPLKAMIELAGGTNAATGFEEYKPLTTEAVIAANPDVILMFDSGKESLNGTGGILAVPGVGATNAGKNKAVITMDGQYLSGFGPRVGKAVADLNKELQKVK